MSDITWRALNEQLPRMTEKQLDEALAAEVAGPARASHLLRLHQRKNTLRVARERKALLSHSV